MISSHPLLLNSHRLPDIGDQHLMEEECGKFEITPAVDIRHGLEEESRYTKNLYYKKRIMAL
jgi:hypothetical protein